MSGGAMSGLIEKRARGAAMEAHAGTIGIRTRRRRGRGASTWLTSLRANVRDRRQQRARRAHALRESGASTPYVPGSEHTHLLPRSRGF